jgi:O-antigen/teichoic acid export membrane protein
LLAQLKSLTRDSAIYGVGHIASRLLTFLLLPYYSFHMSPAEYGELTLYFLFVALAQTFFVYGLDIAYLRYFTMSKDPAERKVVTGTVLMTSLMTTVAICLLIVVGARPLGHLIIHSPADAESVPAMVRICAGILFFDTFSTFQFLFLRGSHRPRQFTLVKILNVSVNMGLNIWFVGGLHLSIAGILWANLISSALSLFVMLPSIARNVTVRLDKVLIREMIRFGIPNVPTYLFVMVIELADRKVLELYRGLSEAGLYSAGYKLGMFMAVVTGAFRFAWQPFFLSHSDREDAPQLFSRVLTYYLLVTITLFLALTFFVDPIVKTKWPGVGYIIAPRFWPGLVVFPIILLAHVFDGVYANLMVGIYLKKLTARLPLVTGAAALFTIVGCILLVPPFGMIAAAWITLVAFFMEAVLLWLVVRKEYPVPYEWSRIGKLSLACGIILALGLFTGLNAAWQRALVLLLFPGLLYVFGFLDEREKFHLKKLLPVG